MGQKVNPIAYRLGINRASVSRWYAAGELYIKYLLDDYAIRAYIKKKLGRRAMISMVIIDRSTDSVSVTIFTGRPGMIIGKKGKGIEELSEGMLKVSKCTFVKKASVNVKQIKNVEACAQLVAEDIAAGLENRGSYKVLIRRALQAARRLNVLGIKIMVKGRLGGAEIARTETQHVGSVPTSKLRACIDYGEDISFTTAGTIGVKVWIYRMDIMEHNPRAFENYMEKMG